MAEFNIKKLTARTATLVGRDQINIGPGAQYVHFEAARREVEVLRRQLRQLDLKPKERGEAEQEIEGLDAELTSRRPNQKTMGKRLRRLTEILHNAGALAAAGQALREPLGNLAHWIGTQL